MFERLGHFVSRNWTVLLTGWIVALALLWWVAPKWDTVLYDGEFHYLPERFPTRQAENLSTNAFANESLRQQHRHRRPARASADGLLDEDKTFIDETWSPACKQAIGLSPEKSADAGDESSDSNRRGAKAAQAAAGTNRAANLRLAEDASRSSPASTPFRTRNSANC